MRVAVAVSGGRDSMALLHCTARAAKPLGIQVLALHVHHGLQADADAWVELVERTCRRWTIDFATRRLTGTPARSESLEAWARRGRYRALAEMARAAGAGLVLLAHHQRDQVETFLLQALRGGGPAGLAAMPAQIEREGIIWSRPWLAQPETAVAAYARRHRLRFVDDPTNTDPRFARSRLRGEVMPALRDAFPGAEAALATAALRSAQAQAVLVEVATADLAELCDGMALRLAPWGSLSLPRRRNALQTWLHQQVGRGAPYTLVDRLMGELLAPGSAQWQFEGFTLRRYRARLAVSAHDGSAASGAAGSGFAPHLSAVEQGGIATTLLCGAEWRPRCGGERFQRAAGTPPRGLKKQFQAAGVAAWQREAPLLFSADGRLLFVPGLGIDARVLAAPGEPQQAVAWLPLG